MRGLRKDISITGLLAVSATLVFSSACSYISLSTLTSEKPVSAASAKISKGRLAISGVNLDEVTSVILEQNSVRKTLSIDSKTSDVLKAVLDQSLTLKAGAPVSLLLSTANAQVPVTLTIDLDGTTVSNLKFADQTALSSNGQMIVVDTQPDGAGVVSCPQNLWNTRVLNTVVENTIPNASLASNQITLPAGTFLFEADAPAGGSDVHQAQLYNVTSGSMVAAGSMGRSTNGSGVLTVSTIISKVSLNASTVFEVRHRCQGASGFLTRASPGWGVPALFTIVKIRSL